MNANTSVNHVGYSANQNGPILLTGGSISIQWLPESDQQKLLAAATELIVNRTSPVVDHLPATISPTSAASDTTSVADPIRRVDDEHAMTISSHLAHNIARYQGQLRGSVNAIRQSILRLESKLRDQSFDNKMMVGKSLSAHNIHTPANRGIATDSDAKQLSEKTQEGIDSKNGIPFRWLRKSIVSSADVAAVGSDRSLSGASGVGLEK